MRRMDEKGVSPVIGVILMVAITVILAAVIASFVFGMAGTVKRTYTVAATASETCQGDNNCTISITYRGGPDHPYVIGLNVTQCGTNTTPASLSVQVGATHTCDGTPGRNDHVVVVARFADGTEQVILDTYV